ncbi:cell division protein FtsQ/DivIB [Microbulbifer sp. TYP-18]|uniref:cell division protein FtsQ/DivIB n=1 Tax=Microbulbifer sp. TYP-18 TaxID=3230024 RepID=UPI0034C5E2A4
MTVKRVANSPGKKAAVKKTRGRGASRRPEKQGHTGMGRVPKLLLLAVALVALVAGVGYAGLQGWRQFPIGGLVGAKALEQVEVRGPFRAVSQREIEEMLLPFLGRGFFSVDIQGMRAALLRHPWITAASVSRRWPRGVEVVVQEARPLAVWGGDQLLVASGALLPRPPGMVTGRLPELAGDEELVEQIMSQYQALAGLLTARDMEVKRLTFDDLAGWQLELVSGIELYLGHDELLERINRFLNLSRGVLAPYLAKVARVDTRYSNAVAVQWRERKE